MASVLQLLSANWEASFVSAKVFPCAFLYPQISRSLLKSGLLALRLPVLTARLPWRMVRILLAAQKHDFQIWSFALTRERIVRHIQN